MSIARLVIFALSGLVATNAFAATVSVIPQEGTLRGNLYVNRGKGFEAIVNITEAHTGDSVMASGSGRAVVVYEDGCKVEVSAKTSVVTVQETSPCKGGAVIEAPSGAAVGKWAIGAASSAASWRPQSSSEVAETTTDQGRMSARSRVSRRAPEQPAQSLEENRTEANRKPAAAPIARKM